MIHAPVTLETNGTFGAPSRIVRQNRSNSGRMGSSIFECAATEMWMRVVSTSRRASSTSSASIAAAGPEATQSPGAFTAAIDSSSPSSGTSAASASATLSIAPAGRLSKRRPRTSTSAMPSRTENTPARQAATYSPRL